MKLFSLCFAILLLLPWNALSQSTSPVKVKNYKAIIKTNYGTKEKGFLYGVTDSSILLVRKRADLATVSKTPFLINEVSAKNINIIKIRRNGSILTGAAAGVVVAIPVGILMRKRLDEKEYGDDVSLVSGVFDIFLHVSAPLIMPWGGALIGSLPKKKVEVYGSTDLFKMHSFTMAKYSYCLQRDIALQMIN